MVEKSKILEAWIMVEHLSEGDLSGRSVLTLDDLQGQDFCALFQREMKKKRFRPGQKGGIVVYFDIFSFREVVSILREQYGLKPTEEEIRVGNKFSLALYFDRNLNFLEDMTFFTESAYIRYYKKAPREEDFRNFEENLKKQLTQDFAETAESPEKFNGAMQKTLLRYGIDVRSCRMQVLNNVETEGRNLHSFFIGDLEKAKGLDTANLRAYLYGTDARRVNLDSKRESAHFNARAFEEILQPSNYPLGRFPSSTAYALSLMQQTAVNLSIGVDTQTIRSVNGPPGTGKTTLLKDIFAQLVVQQAYDIAKLPEHLLSGTKEAELGVIPAGISENGIVVASSNNGAVQNIVNELPLCQGVDAALLEELREADYFREIANARVSVQWTEGENGKKQPELVREDVQGEERFWGVFSLEGGKADNMTNILTHMKHIHKYLEEEYLPDKDVYKAFLKQYEAVRALRAQAQTFAHSLRARRDCADELERARTSYQKESARREMELEEALRRLDELGQECSQELPQLQLRLEAVGRRKETAQRSRDSLELCLKLSRDQKPGFFAGKREKEAYKSRLRDLTDQLIGLQSEDAECARLENELRSRIARLRGRLTQSAEKQAGLRREFAVWTEAEKAGISGLEKKVREHEQTIAGSRARPLDMEQAYDELQLSNPWFDETYRLAQSRLFLAALRVRKQFLYENRRNVRTAFCVWSQQEKYLEQRSMIEAAWGWINMTVPVISSTFASFARMCKNLGAETLGRLFIDEAGQALPQAAVGAVFRSRHVMVVGDPSQIKPVLTLDSNTLSMLSRHFGVTEKYLSASASAQTLVDAASQYGFYRKQDQSEESWIGIPLWVHRRCRYPMFTISNNISYDGFMVQGLKRSGRTGWFDVGGRASGKYVEEQGEFLVRKLRELIERDPRITNTEEKDVVYVITPFSNVAYQLSQKLQEIRFTRCDAQGKPTNVGTVHTFQGKEAPIVFFVLGADRQSSGAARWAMSEPNMMNVAATRAKEEFYIIGDRDLYLGLGCDVASETDRVIRQYKKQHPELVEESVHRSAEKMGPAPARPAEKEDPLPPACPARTTGTVSRVRMGHKNFYAYVFDDAGNRYTINEIIYSKTEQAGKVIQAGRRISFVPAKGSKGLLATDVKPEIRAGL